MTETTSVRNAVCALLADGTTVRLRPACPEDRAQALRFYDEMSADSLRNRFFMVSRRSGERAADRLCAPGAPGHRTLAAFQGDRLVGVAEYETGDDPATAEIALAVADDFHHRGVGTLLLEHLVHTARENGVVAFTADALADNHLIHRVLADLGLHITRRYDGTTVHGVISLEPDENYLAAMDLRGRTAGTASLGPLLRPRSVAVIGAGTRPGLVGRAILHNLRGGHFRGLLHAVDPHDRAILHVPAFASVSDLPAPPDLAVIAVPAADVPGVAEECGRAGVKALVVVAAGLDADLTAELTAVCRRWGMRMAGPNCLGIADTEPDVRLDATFAVGRPLPGTAGVAVQSGGVGVALLDGLSRLGIGVSSGGSGRRRHSDRGGPGDGSGTCAADGRHLSGPSWGGRDGRQVRTPRTEFDARLEREPYARPIGPALWPIPVTGRRVTSFPPTAHGAVGPFGTGTRPRRSLIVFTR
ncbi:hypothetical protein GCM10010211_33120 [Streptomyces albospinus]|uniref:N-acetyltransferase domain-containing protein n=1 Tax=Streptomyces albospinus TaxID=285515 RepID=A0ABQ2V562_9ACTN|nr:GNAT family N-acetyltransferase [Streptomyces albospinus]GGU65376.1 hypothetical protein GCM10010211_33120 [Streptomyces albospinus]